MILCRIVKRQRRSILYLDGCAAHTSHTHRHTHLDNTQQIQSDKDWRRNSVRCNCFFLFVVVVFTQLMHAVRRWFCFVVYFFFWFLFANVVFKTQQLNGIEIRHNIFGLVVDWWWCDVISEHSVVCFPGHTRDCLKTQFCEQNTGQLFDFWFGGCGPPKSDIFIYLVWQNQEQAMVGRHRRFISVLVFWYDFGLTVFVVLFVLYYYFFLFVFGKQKSQESSLNMVLFYLVRLFILISCGRWSSCFQGQAGNIYGGKWEIS